MLEKVDTLVVDKTGTLTEGKPALVSVVPAAGSIEARAAARWPRASSAASEHPLAAAIVAGARERGVDAGRGAEDSESLDRQGRRRARSTGARSRSATPRCCAELRHRPERARRRGRGAARARARR